MARGTKKKISTRSEEYIINKKHLGEEPTFTKPLTRIDYANALNWYNYMCNSSDAREYITTYLKNIGRPEDAKRLKAVSDTWIPNTVAWVCRLITRGYVLPVEPSGFIDGRIRETLDRATEVKEDTDTPKISIQDRMKEKSREIIGEIEEMIDGHFENNDEFSLYNWLQTNNIPAAYASSIVSKFNPILIELIEAFKGTDDQLKEGYRRYKKSELEKLIYFYNGICEDAERYANVSKKVKATRKPRTVSVEKKIKNLKWQKEDATYKIASILPEKIIDSQELWTFNTKYKTLTVLRAQDRGGLQVKGTSITNFDPQNSYTRGTGRKTEDTVRRVLDGGKIVLRKIMDELKTEKALAYRINENTILLRVTT